jgi:Cu(I)/Ag(I) efflux system membrane fusion protein
MTNINDRDRTVSVSERKRQRSDSLRWWLKLILQPLLFLGGGVLLIVSLGISQRLGWISAGHLGETSPAAPIHASSDDLYICPMMCVPPQSEPGRCPVCGMKLVLTASKADTAGSLAIQIDPVARRVANIRTATVESAPLLRRIRTIGELRYDESALKTLAAYVDGRLERLYADYTGVLVEQGDPLALLYSPRLYSSQVELLLAKKARDRSLQSTLPGTAESARGLYESARQRLLEFGMTEDQIATLERDAQASSRLALHAPIDGTVIERLVAEGQYVKEGQAIYRLADLSSVWLMLELYPEDAASVRFGQRVEARMQSLPGRTFTGRVAFIDPSVDSRTRTVGVRVVFPNPQGVLRVGDYATATVETPILGSVDEDDEHGVVYDPDLANKWISPRHPHVIESDPGQCRLCGVDLLPASHFGFASQPLKERHSLLVPRNAVLMAGGNSVVYVETEPGRFELRRVVLGASSGEKIAVLQGLEAGEQVAVDGNFLIDSQMQLSGKPSLLDPAKAEEAVEDSAGADEQSIIDLLLDDLPPMDLPMIEVTP